MLILSEQEVRERLDPRKLIDALATAMVDLSAGRASVPQRIAAVVEGAGILGAMPGYCPSLNVLAAKLVTVFPNNPERSHQAVIVAFDPANGTPIALMDGTYITALRTACGSGLATQLLAREDSTVLAVLGTGVQAEFHARCIPLVRQIKEICFAGRNPAKAVELAAKMQSELDIPCRAGASWRKAIQEADIVCATTHPPEPVVRWEWLSAGAHVNSVGTSPAGHEIDRTSILNARVFVENRATAASAFPSGSTELHSAVVAGELDASSLVEIGEVIAEPAKGRQNRDEVTLYKSVGVAVQDAAAVSVVLREADLPTRNA